MSHRAGHGAYDNYKNQSRQSDRAWEIRKQQIIAHAKRFRDLFAQDQYRELHERMSHLAKSLDPDGEDIKIYRSPQSRKWLASLKSQLETAAWSMQSPGRGGEKYKKFEGIPPKKLLQGFRAIAREEIRYRNQLAKQERANAASKHQWSPSSQNPEPFVRTPESNTNYYIYKGT